MDEVWRDLLELSGDYQISDMGRVRSRKWNGGWRILSPQNNGESRLRVGIYHNGVRRRVYVHHLVMKTFVGEAPDGHEVNHKNGNPSDNRLCNLEYVTHSENMRHALSTGLRKMPKGTEHFNARLTEADIVKIRNLYSQNKKDIKELAQMFSVTEPHIRKIIKRKMWKHIL